MPCFLGFMGSDILRITSQFCCLPGVWISSLLMHDQHCLAYLYIYIDSSHSCCMLFVEWRPWDGCMVFLPHRVALSPWFCCGSHISLSRSWPCARKYYQCASLRVCCLGRMLRARSSCAVLLRCISLCLERLKPFCKLGFDGACVLFLPSLSSF